MLSKGAKKYLEFKRKFGKVQFEENDTTVFVTHAGVKKTWTQTLFNQKVIKEITWRIVMLICARVVLGDWNIALKLVLISGILYAIHEGVWSIIKRR